MDWNPANDRRGTIYFPSENCIAISSYPLHLPNDGFIPEGETKRGLKIAGMSRDQLRHLLRTSTTKWEKEFAKHLLG